MILKFLSFFIFIEWRRGLYELISNGIQGNIKKDSVVQTLGELTVRLYSLLKLCNIVEMKGDCSSIKHMKFTCRIWMVQYRLQ